MILNIEQTQAQQPSSEVPLVFIHGLFGSIGNLGMLARAFQQTHNVIQVDVRNHGHSAHDPLIDYQAMAEDVLETLADLNLYQFSVIGHSMGGKIAMKLAELAPQRLQQLVVLDMAPFAYAQNHHDVIFEALFAVQNAQIETRKQATEIMQHFIKEAMVIQFLLKSFNQGKWLFNVDALHANYAHILDWTEIAAWQRPALFIRGGRSDYVTQAPQVAALEQQFPLASIKTIDGVGHWLHAEQPQLVLDEIRQYLESKS